MIQHPCTSTVPVHTQTTTCTCTRLYTPARTNVQVHAIVYANTHNSTCHIAHNIHARLHINLHNAIHCENPHTLVHILTCTNISTSIRSYASTRRSYAHSMLQHPCTRTVPVRTPTTTCTCARSYTSTRTNVHAHAIVCANTHNSTCHVAHNIDAQLHINLHNSNHSENPHTLAHILTCTNISTSIRSYASTRRPPPALLRPTHSLLFSHL